MSILALDFGGTRLRAAWFDEKLTLQSRVETLTGVADGQAVVLERLVTTARQVVPPNVSISGIGVAAPGPLNAAEGVIYHADTLPGWQNVPLATYLREQLGAPVFVENDANLAALAEYQFGAGQGCDPLLYLTLSTGIGGGAVIGGRLFTGYGGLAPEPGHQLLTLPTGEVRKLETLASGTAIGAAARQRLQTSDEPTRLREVSDIDARAVALAAQQGDAVALELVNQAGHWLGLGLVNLVHLFNPRAIVVGAVVATLGDLLFAPARVVLNQYVLNPAFLPRDLIRPAALSDDVCLYGAAYHAQTRFNS